MPIHVCSLAEGSVSDKQKAAKPTERSLGDCVTRRTYLFC
jgi:hypothetical protein